MDLIWSQYAAFLENMTLTWALFLLPVGLLVLIKGADWLVEGSVAIAKHFGMSPLIIGLTIVAMGTSAPEVAASIKAASDNLPGLAAGNVYGSNLANLALVGGLCAIIRPISVAWVALRRDIPLMVAAALLLFGIFYTGRLFETGGYTFYPAYAFGSMVFLLVVFTGVIVYMIHSERIRAKQNIHVLEESESSVEHAAPHQPKSLWLSIAIIIGSLLCLAEGATVTVASATVIGSAAGMSETVIGVTIVALGTSLPELLTCLIAAFKGHDDLSVGNLVGSNIFNTLLVIGAAGVVRPFSALTHPELIGWSYWLMIAVMGMFTIIAFATKKISRFSGFLLFAAYVGFIIYSLTGGGTD